MARKKPRRPSDPAPESECIQFSNERSLHVGEQGIGATFLNPKRKELREIKYDGCYFRDAEGGRAADYIVGFAKEIDVILELKGSDLNCARLQVTDTLERWRDDPIHYPQIVCLIVFGHTFPRMSSRLGALERDFLGRHGILLRIKQSGAGKFNFRRLAGKL